jgi:outer membrane lipoprotein-sorting protein
LFRIRFGIMLLAVAVMVRMAAPAASQRSGPWTLEAVLRQLNSAAQHFHSLTADVERTKVTVVVGDYSKESGQIYVHGTKMRLDLTSPDARTIVRNGETLYIYNPKLKRVEEYDLGKYRAKVDQFLLLGFGTAGSDLEKNYRIMLVGEPTLDNQKVVWLELAPNSEEVRKQISKIHLWLDESSWLPVQQKFFETGSEDYFVIRYSNIVRNAKIDDSLFKPHWPHGTVKFRPQG